jgi:hypothetical protein
VPPLLLRGWALVLQDDAPFFAEPGADGLAGWMSAGLLVERRDETRPDMKNEVPIQIDLEGPESRVRRAGPLVAIRTAGSAVGFAYASDLGPAPQGLPTRSAICTAVRERVAWLSEKDCDQHLRAAVSGAARLIAWVATDPMHGVLALLETGGKKPAVLAMTPGSVMTRLRQFAPPQGPRLLLAQEMMNRGGISGGQTAVFAIEGERLRRILELPLQSSGLRNDVVTNVRARLLTNGATGQLRLEGEEREQNSLTGQELARRTIGRVLIWDENRATLVDAH